MRDQDVVKQIIWSDSKILKITVIQQPQNRQNTVKFNNYTYCILQFMLLNSYKMSGPVETYSVSSAVIRLPNWCWLCLCLLWPSMLSLHHYIAWPISSADALRNLRCTTSWIHIFCLMLFLGLHTSRYNQRIYLRDLLFFVRFCTSLMFCLWYVSGYWSIWVILPWYGIHRCGGAPDHSWCRLLVLCDSFVYVRICDI